MLFKIFERTISAYSDHIIYNFMGIKIKLQRKDKTITAKYAKIEETLREKYQKEKINITFLVSMASMFPAKPLCDYLLSHEKYNVKILLVPDLRFGENNIEKLQEESYNLLKKEYSTDIIIKSPINEKEDDIDIKNFTDIMFFSLPYDVSYQKYSLFNIIKLGILPASVNYAFYRSKYERKRLISNQVYSQYWKVFTETIYNHNEFKKYSPIKGKNCVLTGYCKMDGYKNYENCKHNTEKTIIIAPHHSVTGGYNDVLSLSNFYKYSDLFLKLPEMYPNINFIFRPHPALFLLLSKDEFWGKEKCDAYLTKIQSKPNVTYDTSNNYFESFAKSDGIIQDCGSYLVEYFYTNKPQCYMLKSNSDINQKFVDLGKKCLQHCYIAYNEKGITDFIDSVIIQGNDYKKEAREIFANKEIMLNYPNVSSEIVKHFETILKKES